MKKILFTTMSIWVLRMVVGCGGSAIETNQPDNTSLQLCSQDPSLPQCTPPQANDMDGYDDFSDPSDRQGPHDAIDTSADPTCPVEHCSSGCYVTTDNIAVTECTAPDNSYIVKHKCISSGSAARYFRNADGACKKCTTKGWKAADSDDDCNDDTTIPEGIDPKSQWEVIVDTVKIYNFTNEVYCSTGLRELGEGDCDVEIFSTIDGNTMQSSRKSLRGNETGTWNEKLHTITAEDFGTMKIEAKDFDDKCVPLAGCSKGYDVIGQLAQEITEDDLHAGEKTFVVRNGIPATVAAVLGTTHPLFAFVVYVGAQKTKMLKTAEVKVRFVKVK